MQVARFMPSGGFFKACATHLVLKLSELSWVAQSRGEGLAGFWRRLSAGKTGENEFFFKGFPGKPGENEG